MKKQKQKMMSVFVILTILFSLAVPAYADGGISPQRLDWEVSMTIAAYPKPDGTTSINGNGHAFLAFYNDSSVKVTVGHMTVEPGSSVTVGTFENRSAHRGIWYNIEGHDVNKINTHPDLYLVTTSLTKSQLDTVNAQINQSDLWEYWYNCSSFARDVWNSAAPSSMQLSGNTPDTLSANIKNLPGHKTTLSSSMFYQPISKIARHTPTSYVYDPSGATENN